MCPRLDPGTQDGMRAERQIWDVDYAAKQLRELDGPLETGNQAPG